MSVSINSVPMDHLVYNLNGNTPNGQMQGRINQLLQLFDHSRRFKEIFTPRWKRNYEYYHSIDRELLARPEHASKLFIPRPYLVVETKTPKLVQGIVAKDPMFTVLPYSSDDIVRARISQELLTRQWRSQENQLQSMTNWIKDSFVYGLGVAKTCWEYKMEWMPQRAEGPTYLDPISMQMVTPDVEVAGWKVTVDRPAFLNVDIANFFWDPSSSTIEDCNYIIERQEVSRNTLKNMEQAGVYQNIDMVPQNQPGVLDYSGLNNRQWTLRNHQAANGSGDYRMQNDPVYETVEVLTFWWVDGQRKFKTVVANRKVIIQDVPMPYHHNRWPYYKLVDTPLPGEFVGLGEIDVIADLTRELNEMRNQQNDNRNQFLKAFWIANRSANVDLQQLEDMPPGGILEVTGDPSAALTVMRPPQLDTMTFGGQQQIDADIQMTTGANDIAIGMATRSQVRTATTGNLMADSTETRFGLTALLALEQIRKVGRDMMALNQQFMSQPMAVRVLGADGANMKDINAIPQDIPHQYDLFVTLGSELQGNQDIIRQQSLQMFQTMAQVPGFQLTEYAKEVMGKFGEKNPERFFEGSAVVPTEQIMQAMGIDDDSVMSTYAEQMGGLKGGGTQQVRQAASPADLLQYSANPNMTGNLDAA